MSASVVIVFYYKLEMQKHYTGHQNEVVCLAVGSHKEIVASGDKGPNPHIHIWNINNTSSIKQFNNLPIDSPNLLKFINKDEFLIIVGKRFESPIYIYKIESGELICSCKASSFVFDIVSVHNVKGNISKSGKVQRSFNTFQKEKILDKRRKIVDLTNFDIHKNFFLISKNIVHYFEHRGNNYLKKNIYYKDKLMNDTIFPKIGKKAQKTEPLSKKQLTSTELKCGISFYINSRNSELKVFTEKDEDYENILITGDSDGRICCWSGFINDSIEIKEIDKKDRPITHLLYTGNNKLCVLTDNGDIHITNLSCSETFMTIDLTSLDLKLESLEIKDFIKGNKDQVFLSSSEGEIIKLYLNPNRIWDKASFVNKVNSELVSSIVKLKGDLTSLVLVERRIDKLGFDCQNEKLIFVGGDQSVVYGFSAEDHDLIDKWSVGDSITAMDSFINEEGGIIFVFGTELGKIMFRYDFEEHPKHLEFGKPIIHIKFSPDGNFLACLCKNQNLYLFNNTHNNYFEFDPKSVFFENEIPLTINFLDNTKAIIVTTSEKNYYKLELPDLRNKEKVQENDKFDIANVILRYPILEQHSFDNYSSFYCGQEQKFVVGGDQNGLLFIWKDQQQLLKNCGIALQSHCSRITDIKISNNKDFIFTISKCDNTLMEWKIIITIDSKAVRESSDLKKNEIILKNELYFCSAKKENISFLKDSFGYFRGCSIPLMNKLFGMCKDKSKYQKIINRRYPRKSLLLKRVYGFSLFDKRDSILYAHHIPSLKLNSLNILKFIQQPEYIESFRNINNNFQHRFECKRLFVSFVSRIGIVVREDEMTKQYFYEGHEEKISCISTHSNKLIIATGEAAYNPTIHVWLASNCQQISKLKTFHKVGISSVKFCYKKPHLISLGVDKCFSVQITNWINGHILAFTNTSQNCIIGLEISNSKIEFWEYKGNSLQKANVVEIQNNQYKAMITCMSYFIYSSEDELQTDIIFGTSIGSIGVVTNNNLFLIEGVSHTKMVNCMKIAFVDDQMVIITAGMDDLIKIFDINFRPILTINVRKKEQKTNTELAVQSFDIYNCQSHNFLLIGSKCGEITEHQLSFLSRETASYNEILKIKEPNLTSEKKKTCIKQNDIILNL